MLCITLPGDTVKPPMTEKHYSYLQILNDATELLIDPCSRLDKGKYFICAENEQGRATASVEVFVSGILLWCSRKEL